MTCKTWLLPPYIHGMTVMIGCYTIVHNTIAYDGGYLGLSVPGRHRHPNCLCSQYLRLASKVRHISRRRRRVESESGVWRRICPGREYLGEVSRFPRSRSKSSRPVQPFALSSLPVRATFRERDGLQRAHSGSVALGCCPYAPPLQHSHHRKPFPRRIRPPGSSGPTNHGA